MQSEGKQFGLAYLDADEAGAYLETHRGRILSVIGFGRAIALPETACAPLWIDIPVLGGKNSSVEIWSSNAPVSAFEYQGLHGAGDGNVLFGSLSLEQHAGDTLGTLAAEAYMRILQFIDHFG